MTNIIMFDSKLLEIELLVCNIQLGLNLVDDLTAEDEVTLKEAFDSLEYLSELATSFQIVLSK